jgi:2-dehydro-3-deoxyphosphooctonate aldolase (KDO 8-P synthase)
MKLCGFDVGLNHPFFLIAGPCVVESEQLQMDTAGTLKEITSALGIPFIFKSSYDVLPWPRHGEGPGDPGQGQA